MSDELGFIPAAGTLLIPILNKSHNRIPHNYKVLQYCIYEVLRRLGGAHDPIIVYFSWRLVY